MNKFYFSTLIASGLLAFGSSALATGSIASANFNVTAHVQDACVILEANDLDFGNYSPSDTADKEADTTFKVRCTDELEYEIGLGQGSNLDTVNDIRRMKLGSKYLAYQLFKHSAPTQEWGDTDAPGTRETGLTGNGAVAGQEYTIYGTAPAGQFVPSGNYSDTVAINIYVS